MEVDFKGGISLKMRARSLLCPSSWKASLLFNIAGCELFNEMYFLLEKCQLLGSSRSLISTLITGPKLVSHALPHGKC